MKLGLIMKQVMIDDIKKDDFVRIVFMNGHEVIGKNFEIHGKLGGELFSIELHIEKFSYQSIYECKKWIHRSSGYICKNIKIIYLLTDAEILGFKL
jgi:hypothetical protein